MPPSGFSQEAINGLLVFVKDVYQQTLDKYRSKNLSEQGVLVESMAYVDRIVYQSGKSLGNVVSEEGLKGLAKFVNKNYSDLIAEISSGKKTEGQAMETELKDIGEYLAKFSLH